MRSYIQCRTQNWQKNRPVVRAVFSEGFGLREIGSPSFLVLYLVDAVYGHRWAVFVETGSDLKDFVFRKPYQSGLKPVAPKYPQGMEAHTDQGLPASSRSLRKRG